MPPSHQRLGDGPCTCSRSQTAGNLVSDASGTQLLLKPLSRRCFQQRPLSFESFGAQLVHRMGSPRGAQTVARAGLTVLPQISQCRCSHGAGAPRLSAVGLMLLHQPVDSQALAAADLVIKLGGLLDLCERDSGIADLTVRLTPIVGPRASPAHRRQAPILRKLSMPSLASLSASAFSSRRTWAISQRSK